MAQTFVLMISGDLQAPSKGWTPALDSLGQLLEFRSVSDAIEAIPHHVPTHRRQIMVLQVHSLYTSRLDITVEG